MLPSYRKHWFVCIFFFEFIVIGLYGLLQLTIAVVFHSFQLHTKEKFRRVLKYCERALQAVFTLLSEFNGTSGFVTRPAWMTLMKHVRPEWSETQSEIMLQSAITTPNAPPTDAVLDEGKMDYLQFQQIFPFTQKTFQFKDDSGS